jgi:hypothetical protein
MKTYEQWSSRMKGMGKSEDQYSQAAYQGYVNNMNAPKPSGGGSNPKPISPAPPPLQTNPNEELSQQVQQLHDAIEAQNNQFQSDLAKAKAMKPGDASKALNSTLLTGTAGVQDKKKKQNFLQPIGG